jgi:hypothetical protein
MHKQKQNHEACFFLETGKTPVQLSKRKARLIKKLLAQSNKKVRAELPSQLIGLLQSTEDELQEKEQKIDELNEKVLSLFNKIHKMYDEEMHLRKKYHALRNSVSQSCLLLKDEEVFHA